MPHQPIEEFKSLLHQEDYSQLSRKLLDLSIEFSLDASLEQLIYDFRKNYLNEISKEVLATGLCERIGIDGILKHEIGENKKVKIKSNEKRKFTLIRKRYRISNMK